MSWTEFAAGIAKVVSDAAAAGEELAEDTVEVLGEAASTVIDDMTDTANETYDSREALVGKVIDRANALGDVLLGGGDEFADQADMFGDAFVAGTEKLADKAGFYGDALVAGAEKLADKAGVVSEVFVAGTEKLVDRAATAGEFFVDGGAGLWSEGVDRLADGGEFVVDGGAGLWSEGVDRLAEGGEYVVDGAARLYLEGLDVAVEGGEAAVDFGSLILIKGHAGTVSSFSDLGRATIGVDFSQEGEDFQAAMDDAHEGVDQFTDEFSDAYDEATDDAGDFVDDATDWGTDKIDRYTDKFTDVVDRATDVGTDKVDQYTDSFTGAVDRITDWGTDKIDRLTDLTQPSGDAARDPDPEADVDPERFDSEPTVDDGATIRPELVVRWIREDGITRRWGDLDQLRQTVSGGQEPTDDDIRSFVHGQTITDPALAVAALLREQAAAAIEESSDADAAAGLADAAALESEIVAITEAEAAFLAAEAARLRDAAEEAAATGDVAETDRLGRAADGFSLVSDNILATSSVARGELITTVTTTIRLADRYPDLVSPEVVDEVTSAADAADIEVEETAEDAAEPDADGPIGVVTGDYLPESGVGFDSEFDPDVWSYVEAEGIWFNGDDGRFYVRPGTPPIAVDDAPTSVAAGASLLRDAVGPSGDPISVDADTTFDAAAGVFRDAGGHVVAFHRSLADDMRAYEESEVGYSDMAGRPVVFADGHWYTQDGGRWYPVEDVDRYVTLSRSADTSREATTLTGGDFLAYEVTVGTALQHHVGGISLVLDGATGELHGYDPARWDWVDESDGQGYWTTPEGGRYEQPTHRLRDAVELADGEHSATGYYDSRLDTQALTLLSDATGSYWYDVNTGTYSPFQSPGQPLVQIPEGPFTVRTHGEGSPSPLDQFEENTTLRFDPATSTYRDVDSDAVLAFHAGLEDHQLYEVNEVGYSGMTGVPVVFADGAWYAQDGDQWRPVDGVDRYVTVSRNADSSWEAGELAGGDFLAWEVTAHTALQGHVGGIALVLDGATGELHGYDPAQWEWVDESDGGFWTTPEGGRYEQPAPRLGAAVELADGEYSAVGYYDSRLDVEALTLVRDETGSYWLDVNTGTYSPYKSPGLPLAEIPEGPFTVQTRGEGSPPPLDQFEANTTLRFDPATATYRDVDSDAVVGVHAATDGRQYVDPGTAETVGYYAGGAWFDASGVPIGLGSYPDLEDLPEPLQRAVLDGLGAGPAERAVAGSMLVDGSTGQLHTYDPTRWEFDEERGLWIDTVTDETAATPWADPLAPTTGGDPEASLVEGDLGVSDDTVPSGEPAPGPTASIPSGAVVVTSALAEQALVLTEGGGLIPAGDGARQVEEPGVYSVPGADYFDVSTKAFYSGDGRVVGFHQSVAGEVSSYVPGFGIYDGANDRWLTDEGELIPSGAGLPSDGVIPLGEIPPSQIADVLGAAGVSGFVQIRDDSGDRYVAGDDPTIAALISDPDRYDALSLDIATGNLTFTLPGKHGGTVVFDPETWVPTDNGWLDITNATTYPELGQPPLPDSPTTIPVTSALAEQALVLTEGGVLIAASDRARDSDGAGVYSVPEAEYFDVSTKAFYSGDGRVVGFHQSVAGEVSSYVPGFGIYDGANDRWLTDEGEPIPTGAGLPSDGVIPLGEISPSQIADVLGAAGVSGFVLIRDDSGDRYVASDDPTIAALVSDPGTYGSLSLDVATGDLTFTLPGKHGGTVDFDPETWVPTDAGWLDITNATTYPELGQPPLPDSPTSTGKVAADSELDDPSVDENGTTDGEHEATPEDEGDTGDIDPATRAAALRDQVSEQLPSLQDRSIEVQQAAQANDQAFMRLLQEGVSSTDEAYVAYLETVESTWADAIALRVEYDEVEALMDQAEDLVRQAGDGPLLQSVQSVEAEVDAAEVGVDTAQLEANSYWAIGDDGSFTQQTMGDPGLYAELQAAEEAENRAEAEEEAAAPETTDFGGGAQSDLADAPAVVDAVDETTPDTPASDPTDEPMVDTSEPESVDDPGIVSEPIEETAAPPEAAVDAPDLIDDPEPEPA